MNQAYEDLPVPDWVVASATIVPPPRRGDVVSNVIDQEIVLSGPGPDSVFYLNETASIIWTGCDGFTSTREMAVSLVARYEVPFELALDNVEQTVAWFAESGLLETADER